MQLCRIAGELHVLGKNEAVRLLLEKHRHIELAMRVCQEPRVVASLERARQFVRWKMAEYGIPLEV